MTGDDRDAEIALSRQSAVESVPLAVVPERKLETRQAAYRWVESDGTHEAI